MVYLSVIGESSGLSRVYMFLSAISYHHRRLGSPSPCDHPQVKMFMKGLKRVDSTKPVKRARPLTVAMLTQMVQLLENDNSLVTWRTVWRAVISFTCFLRWDDVKRLQVCQSLIINLCSLPWLILSSSRSLMWLLLRMTMVLIIVSLWLVERPISITRMTIAS